MSHEHSVDLCVDVTQSWGLVEYLMSCVRSNTELGTCVVSHIICAIEHRVGDSLSVICGFNTELVTRHIHTNIRSTHMKHRVGLSITHHLCNRTQSWGLDTSTHILDPHTSKIELGTRHIHTYIRSTHI